MKLIPYNAPRRQRSTKRLTIALGQSIALLGAILWLTGCSCRVDCSPDISSAIRVIKIISEK